jgi:release factor glutamine methyltransferase
LDVTLSDVSPEALQVAHENGKRNELVVTYVNGDLLKPFHGQKFDYIVCNPPYISEASYEELSPEVKDFEPKRALVAGKSGFEIYEQLAVTLPAVLNPGGKVWFEIGFDQGQSVPSLFTDSCWKNKVLSKDWAGHDRFFFLEIE